MYNDNDDDEKPSLKIPWKSYQKMTAYTDLCEGEVTWFFDVDFDAEEKMFIVGEVYLLEQEAGSADVDIDEEVVAKFMVDLIKKGKTQMPRGWGHSHVNMGTFFSGTDEGTIKYLGEESDTFIIALVMNKRREMKVDLKICSKYYSPRVADLPVLIDYVDEIPQALKDEVKAKVKTRKVYDWKKDWDWSGKKKKEDEQKGKKKPEKDDAASKALEDKVRHCTNCGYAENRHSVYLCEHETYD